MVMMRRVLRPSGVAAILEFSPPPESRLGALYRFYFRRLLPAIGRVVSGDTNAYQYLPDSVSKFPGPVELAQAMRRAGFRDVRYELLTGGIVALHTGVAE